jgi:hypothetical protein
MKHIHFVIYRLKSIIICCCLFTSFIYLLTYFIIICIYSEIEFFKPLDNVKIQRRIITFTKDGHSRTVFINKMINSGIIKMFIYFYNVYIYIFYFVSQVFCTCIDNRDWFSLRNIFFCCNDFIFLYLII